MQVSGERLEELVGTESLRPRMEHLHLGRGRRRPLHMVLADEQQTGTLEGHTM